MAIRRILSACALLLALCAPGSAAERDARAAFDRLLNEAGLHMNRSGDFVDLAPEANEILPYEHAVRHQSGDLEVRFIVRPLERIRIEYDDPHNAAPEPNHLFPLLFESITYRLSADREYSSRTFHESEAQNRFNADWAAASAFDVVPGFGGEFRNALLIAMHRNETADAYTLFLYNDPERAKQLINEAISIMSFAPGR